jgi:hypothetical protein
VVAERIASGLPQAGRSRSDSVVVTASIGILGIDALNPIRAQPSILIDRADQALCPRSITAPTGPKWGVGTQGAEPQH